MPDSKKVNKDNETCCALCNYYTVTDDTHEDACELHRVNFGKKILMRGDMSVEQLTVVNGTTLLTEY